MNTLSCSSITVGVAYICYYTRLQPCVITDISLIITLKSVIIKVNYILQYRWLFSIRHRNHSFDVITDFTVRVQLVSKV